MPPPPLHQLPGPGRRPVGAILGFLAGALVVIGLWIVLQLFSGIGSIAAATDSGGVAYMAHIGGFAAGLLLTFLLGGNRGGSPGIARRY